MSRNYTDEMENRNRYYNGTVRGILARSFGISTLEMDVKMADVRGVDIGRGHEPQQQQQLSDTSAQDYGASGIWQSQSQSGPSTLDYGASANWPQQQLSDPSPQDYGAGAIWQQQQQSGPSTLDPSAFLATGTIPTPSWSSDLTTTPQQLSSWSIPPPNHASTSTSSGDASLNTGEGEGLPTWCYPDAGMTPHRASEVDWNSTDLFDTTRDMGIDPTLLVWDSSSSTA